MCAPQSSRRLSLVQATVGLAALGAALFLPGLASEPFWDGDELRYADAAKGIDGADVPALMRMIVAVGLRLHGAPELGARLPVAILAVLALLGIFYAGVAIIGSRRAAFVAAIAFAATPALAFAGRHLDLFAPLTLANALFMGGLGQLVFVPAPGGVRRCGLALVAAVGLVGMVAFAGWASLSPPLLALAVLAPAQSTKARRGFVLISLAGILTVAGLLANSTRLATAAHFAESLDGLLRLAGFGLAPWIVLAPLLLIDTLTRDTRADMWLLFAFIVGFCAQPLLTGPAGAELPGTSFTLFLLIGRFVDDMLGASQARPLHVLAVVCAVAVLGHDLLATPELLFPAAASSGKFPPLHPQHIVACLALWAGLVAALLLSPSLPGAPLRQALLITLMLAPLAGAWRLAHSLAPAVAAQRSLRAAYRLASTLTPAAPIRHYNCSERGARYARAAASWSSVGSPADLADALAAPTRVFVLAPTRELPLVDEAARRRKARYFLFAQSNEECQLLSNQVLPGEPALPPPFPQISDQPPHPRFTVDAEWDGALQLIGYDLPTRFSRSQPFELKLYFHVKAPLSDQNKLLVHLDGPGERIYANHYLLDGRYPVNHWPAGAYIVDTHVIDYSFHDDMSELGGVKNRYEVYVGFFGGAKDVNVTRGPVDRDGRLHLTSMELTE
jgi:hypothetical protein